MKKLLLGSAAIILALALTQCWQRGNNVSTGMGTTTGTTIDQGAKLYGEYCSRCHQLGGEGGLPTTKPGIDAPDIREATKSEQQLVAFISNGWGNMPSFKDSMPDESISMIAQYVVTHIEKHPGSAPTSAQNQ